jgi:hypothetical protein
MKARFLEEYKVYLTQVNDNGKTWVIIGADSSELNAIAA